MLGHAPGRKAVVPPGVVGGVVQTMTPVLPWDRTGNSAAATAAGFVEVWSTIRLLIMRGSESTTEPVVCAYEVEVSAGVRAGRTRRAARRVGRPGP